jgi:hypothetical protein
MNSTVATTGVKASWKRRSSQGCDRRPNRTPQTIHGDPSIPGGLPNNLATVCEAIAFLIATLKFRHLMDMLESRPVC